jgi:uncharacterized membrane protein HdeD (DUF308 family)
LQNEIEEKFIEDEPYKSPQPTEKKPIWPWILLQFLPTVVIAILALTFRQIPLMNTPKFVCVAILIYGYILSFFFYRSRGKSISVSLLISLLVGVVIFAANVILVAAIVFVGCAIALSSGGRIAP